MKINLEGYEGIPEQTDFYIENEQSIELCSSLMLDEVIILFSNIETTRSLVARSVNNVPIEIPKDMLKANTSLHIEIKLMEGSKIVRNWIVKPIALKNVGSGLEGHTMEIVQELNTLIDRVDMLTEKVKSQDEEIAQLKQRINPIKDII